MTNIKWTYEENNGVRLLKKIKKSLRSFSAIGDLETMITWEVEVRNEYQCLSLNHFNQLHVLVKSG